MSVRAIAIMILIGFTVLMATIGYGTYINRNKEHVYTTEEIYSNECAKRGGNTTTKTGFDNGIYVQEYKCEGAK